MSVARPLASGIQRTLVAQDLCVLDELEAIRDVADKRCLLNVVPVLPQGMRLHKVVYGGCN